MWHFILDSGCPRFGVGTVDARLCKKTIKAGMHESQEALKKQQAELEKHQEALKVRQAQLTEHQAKIAANKADIEAAVARFGQLDDYYIFDELTIYFANGKVKVDPKYTPQLLALADKGKKIDGCI